jgi:DNA-binding MarR family transcriptional regulator
MDLKTIMEKMNRMFMLHRYYIYKAATKNGLYIGQLPILEQVHDCETCTQKELSEHLGVSAPSIATSVKRMQKAGLIEKTHDSEDLRRTLIHLTKKGKELSELCRKDFDQIDQKMFRGFSEEECSTLSNFVERMQHNLEEEKLTPSQIHAVVHHRK